VGLVKQASIGSIKERVARSDTKEAIEEQCDITMQYGLALLGLKLMISEEENTNEGFAWRSLTNNWLNTHD